MLPEDDINRTYQTALNWVKDKLKECEIKYTNPQNPTYKLYNVLYVIERNRFYVIERNKFKIGERPNKDYQNDMLYIIFNVGVLTGITSYYLSNGNLTKEQMLELNKIYRKYK